MIKPIKFNVFYVFILMLTMPKVYAQYSETIASGRPGNANGAGTVGKGILQFQAGIQYDESSFQSDFGEIRNMSFSENLVVRFGLAEKFEISNVINYSNSTSQTPTAFNGETKASGFNTTMLRARYSPVPGLAFQAGLNFPVLENDFQTDKILPKIRVMYNTQFTENIGLTTNLGAQWDAVDDNPFGFYVFSLSAGLPASFVLIVESYGDWRSTRFNDYYDAAIAYLVNNDLQLDINAGWGSNFGVDSYFITAGFSYRMITGYRD